MSSRLRREQGHFHTEGRESPEKDRLAGLFLDRGSWIDSVVTSRSMCRSERKSMNSPAEPGQRPAAQQTGFGELILAKSLKGYSNRDAH